VVVRQHLVGGEFGEFGEALCDVTFAVDWLRGDVAPAVEVESAVNLDSGATLTKAAFLSVASERSLFVLNRLALDAALDAGRDVTAASATAGHAVPLSSRAPESTKRALQDAWLHARNARDKVALEFALAVGPLFVDGRCAGELNGYEADALARFKAAHVAEDRANRAYQAGLHAAAQTPAAVAA
jgi:hypothetical protein